MRFLRDFYLELPARDRAVFWVAVALSLAVGFGGQLIVRRPQPADAAAPALTAPPFELRFAAAGRT